MTKIHDVAPIAGDLTFATQSQLAEGNVAGLAFDCPLCPGDDQTHVHAVDTRVSTRVALFGQGERPVIDILIGCEEGRHVLVLEIGNRRGEINMGIRAPYAGEVISVWKNGSFDNWVLDGLVRFNPDFSHKVAK